MRNEAQTICQESTDVLRDFPGAFRGLMALVAVDRLEKLQKDFDVCEERFGGNSKDDVEEK